LSCSPYLFTVISKILLPIVLIAAPILALGQSASISSPASVCLGELITFQYSTSGTASSQTWDFGDGLSSTQASPSHTFSTPGPTTVSVQVVLANGTSVNATKNIVVHDLPQPDFSLDGSSFCLNNQNICLTDNSTMGTTTIGYASRIVLWGNGATTSSNSPSSAKNICYTGYQSTANNPYTILVEVVNDKGCEAKWQQDISILPDFIPGFLGSV
jgi:PKD repeat protein